MSFASAFGETAFGEPSARLPQGTVTGGVAFLGAAAFAPAGLQVDAPFVHFQAQLATAANGTLTLLGRAAFSGKATFIARGGDMQTRLLTRDRSIPVWAVELKLYRAR